MSEPEWVRRDTVLALHERLLAEFGGAAGIRDEALLDSALSRPLNRHGYEQPNIVQLAASYAFGLIRNHPFVDGNKRTGFAVTALFLQLNDRELTASEVDATINTLALAAGEMTEQAFADWLGDHS